MDASPFPPAETFAHYLARFLIAKEGLIAGAPIAGARPLEQAFDIVLTQDDDTFRLICILDREADPQRRLALAAADLERVGEECLKHAGRRGFVIDVLVIGAGRAAADDAASLRPARRGMFSRPRISIWQLDTEAGTVRTDAWLWGLGQGRWTYHRLLRRPRLAPSQLQPMPPPAQLPPRPPLATYAVLGLLFLVFAFQHLYAIDPTTRFLGLSTRSLLAQGALHTRAVLEGGEWHRLLVAALLHVNLFHLAINALCLFMAGRLLETMVGRAWFGALFVLGILGGAAGSLLFGPPGLRSVGASPAIMCLFAATFVLSYRQPPGRLRKRARARSLLILLLALMPIPIGGVIIDYAGHMGGAMMGAAVGWGLIRLWPPSERIPPQARAVAVLPAAAILVLAASLMPVIRSHQAFVLRSQLMPPAEIPDSKAEYKQRVAELAERYPRDPRTLLSHAIKLLDAGDLAGGEAQLRRALAETELLALFDAELEWRLRTLLALVLDHRKESAEAKEVAGPVCRNAPEEPLRRLVGHLCH